MTSRIRLVMEGCVMAVTGRKISNAATSASTSSRLRVSWVAGVMGAAYRVYSDSTCTFIPLFEDAFPTAQLEHDDEHALFQDLTPARPRELSFHR